VAKLSRTGTHHFIYSKNQVLREIRRDRVARAISDTPQTPTSSEASPSGAPPKSQTISSNYCYGLYIDEPLVSTQQVTTGQAKTGDEQNLSQTLYYVRNQVYSILATLTPTGEIVQKHDYTAYGKIQTTTAIPQNRGKSSSGQVRSQLLNLASAANGLGNPYTFTGRRFDVETQLYYYRARYYDSQLGRFVSRDPIGFRAGDPNIYRYVFNRPALITDPSGEAIPPLLIIGAAAGAVVIWQGMCFKMSIEYAEEHAANDKEKHCMGACVHNRCSLLIVPAITAIGSILWEIAGQGPWEDNWDDIRADAWGIVQSYGVFAKCKDLCKGCKDDLGLP
jgi:RHS repeat-associated protein